MSPQKTSIPDGWAQGKHPESKKFDKFCLLVYCFWKNTYNCESALDQEHEQLNSLEAQFSKIEEESRAVEMRYLQAKDAEFLGETISGY
jgi:hypothetical protein